MSLLDLVAKITLDKSEYEKGLAGLKADIDEKSNAMKTGMLKVTGAGVAALGAFALASVKTGTTFDKSMSQVAATMGLSMEEMQTQIGSTETAYGHFEGTLRDFAQFMGANTAFSASQAADALNYMALAGYDVNESMSMLPNVLNLAAAGNMDLARASDVVTDVQTAFGLQMEEMPQLIDEMAKAASTGNTSVAQLGDAFLTIGGLAQELNGGFVTLADGTEAPVNGIQELEIALTAMANAGIKGSEAGTHMRNMLMKLASPTSEGTEQLEAMGVAVFDTEGNMRSLADIFGDLSTAMEDMTQEQKIQAIGELFNARDLSSSEAILNAISGDWDDIGASILDAEGAAQKMADTQLDNLSGDITLLKSAFEGFQISLSDKLTPAIRKVVQGVTYFIQNFRKYAPIIAGVATAFGTFAVAINIVGIIRKVGVAVSAFFSLLAANPIALIIAAVAGLVVALMTLWKNNEDFRNAVIEIWGNIKEAIIQVWEAIQVAWGVAKDFFINLWTAVREVAISVWNTISSVAQVVWGAIQAVWNAAVGYFQNIWNTISGIFSAVQSVLEGDFQGAWDAIKGIIDGWADYFQGVWDSIVQVFNDAKSVGSKIVRNILAGIQASWSSLTSWITNKWEAIKKLFHINVTVDTQSSGADGTPGQAIGLDYVPTNRYPALLHKGEAVLTSREADTWRRGEYSRSEQNEELQAILEVLEDIRNNGLDANISGRQIYNAVNGENRKRSRATNYNSLAMA